MEVVSVSRASVKSDEENAHGESQDNPGQLAGRWRSRLALDDLHQVNAGPDGEDDLEKFAIENVLYRLKHRFTLSRLSSMKSR